jgi:hypothetical protein
MSFTQAKKFAEAQLKAGNGPKEKDLAEWLQGKRSLKFGTNRDPASIPASIMAGTYYVYPDQLIKNADPGLSPYSLDSIVWMDRISMAFVRGDQDGDLASILTIGGYLNQKGDQIVSHETMRKLSNRQADYLGKWEQLQRSREGTLGRTRQDIYSNETIYTTDGIERRRLYYRKDPTESRTLISPLKEAFTKGILNDDLKLQDQNKTSLAYLTQKTFTGVIGGYEKTAQGLAFGNENSAWNKLAGMIGADPGAWDELMKRNGIQNLGSADFLDSMRFLNAKNRELFGLTNAEMYIGVLSEMQQRSAIEKINGNPVNTLVNMMRNLNNLGYAGVGSVGFEQAVDFLAERPDAPEQGLMYQFTNQPLDELKVTNPNRHKQIREHSRKILRSVGIVDHAIRATEKITSHQTAKMIAEGKFGEDALKALEYVRATGGYIQELERSPTGSTMAALEQHILGNETLSGMIRNFQTPVMQDLGFGMAGDKTLIRMLLSGTSGTDLFARKTAGRVAKEYLRDFAGEMFRFTDSSVFRKYGKRMAGLAASLQFFDPNTGSMIIGETEGRGGEYSDIPSSDEIRRSYQNRKKVRLNSESPGLKDKMQLLMDNSPSFEARTVRGQPIPEAPKYEYNDYRKRHTAFNVGDYLRRADAVLL